MKLPHVLGVVALGIIAGIALMNFLAADIALFFSFIIIVAGLILLDRKNVKLTGVVIMRRTKRGRNLIDKTAKSASGFWRAAGTIGIILGVLMMIFVSYYLFSQAYGVATGTAGGGVKLLLPGPVSNPINGPGVFVVPWWIWVIGIAIVIIPHEFMHGIMCRIDGVRVKSVGWLLLILIPGAFVEPDEKQLAKQKLSTRLRVYAAGSFANILTAGIILLVAIVFLSGALTPVGVFSAKIENGPAYNASLNGTITELDGQRVLTHDDISRILDAKNPGDMITVKTAEVKYVVPKFGTDALNPPPAAIVDLNSTHTYNIQLSSNPDTGKAYLGISVYKNGQAVVTRDPAVYVLLSTLLSWMFVFSLGIGVVNMLPIGPLDGGQFFGTIVKNKNITRIVSAVMLAVLLFNVVGPLLI